MSVIVALSSRRRVMPCYRCGARRTPVVVILFVGLYRLYEGEIEWP